MKKIPTLFVRDEHDRSRVTDEVHPKCLWVPRGEGVATRKYDGTCVLIRDGCMYRRREVKAGGAIPPEFVQEDYDQQTGKRVGWVPCYRDAKADQWHWEAADFAMLRLEIGTYELVGPRVQGNPEGFDRHRLIAHADATVYDDAPRYFDDLRAWLAPLDIEGLVWHHPDGRMAKIKKRDFGLPRRVQ